jgi:serine/threonine-protein kinase
MPVDDHKDGGDLSGPPEGPSHAGRSVLRELESSLHIAPDLRLREAGAAAAAAPPEFQPTGSRYQVLGTVGTGGMGTVYLAYDHDLKRRVAMKVINPEQGVDPNLVRRFLEEAQATGQLEHPNIVPVYDMGRAEDGRTYYIMRFVQGISMERILQNLKRGDRETRGEYTITRFLQILEQVAMAAHFAHEKGVIHRDLKPSNLMLGTYGEVLVMDWGLVRIVGREEPSTGKRKLIGTPAYMSPEQASGLEAGPVSDVFALGVILYKCLTLRAPFHGLTLEALLADIRSATPAPPRRFHPRLPPELDRITLKALARDPADRFASARAFRDAIQAFLEGVAERRRRGELAEGVAAEGKRRAMRYFQLREALGQAERTAREEEQRTPGWLPIEEKKNLIQLKHRVEEAMQESEHAFSDAVEALSKALGHDPSHRGARGSLADLYFRRFLDAEAEGDERGKQFFRRLVETYHAGRFSAELTGDGTLELNSEPPGADVFLYQYRESGMVLHPDRERHLGRTPIAITLPMGSYLAVLRHEGRRDVRYPIAIERLGEWKGQIQLYRDDEVGRGFLYVPDGPFLQGGDRGTKTSLARATTFVASFFIAEFPVTNSEYLEFLNDLARLRPEEALARAPRRGAESGSYWRLGTRGFEIPEVDSEGDRHDPRWPVLAVSWADAVAYCEWRSARDARRYTLPSEEEWEKAARGVDGRVYPWGNRFDPSLCNMKESRERAGPVPVGSFATDVSPYGVRDLAGNCEEWTAGTWGDARGSRVGRGGSWHSNSVMVRSAYRSSVEPHLASGVRGFRIVSREPAQAR